jgi:hypothetical protein
MDEDFEKLVDTEKAEEAAEGLARLVGTYYKHLYRYGVPEPAAGTLAFGYQTALLAHIFQVATQQKGEDHGRERW